MLWPVWQLHNEMLIGMQGSVAKTQDSQSTLEGENCLGGRGCKPRARRSALGPGAAATKAMREKRKRQKEESFMVIEGEGESYVLDRRKLTGEKAGPGRCLYT